METKAPSNSSPEAFLADVFGTRLVRDGKVIRRALRDIERYYGRDAFIEEVYRRGFRAVDNADQIVVFCNQEPVRILRPKSRQPSKNSSFSSGKSADFP
ncbi:MAG: aspartate aminotransferase [Rhodobacteraceae bacterium]|nr:aspartate aminotransferase [Paracoccaceae bacterium]